MISSALRALTQIFEPPLRAIFWKTLGYTLLLLLLVLAPVSAVPSSESLQTAPLPGTVHFPSPHNLYPVA